MLDRLSALFAPRPRTAEAWLARMARPGLGAWDRASLRTWLEADPDNLRQYERAKADQAALAGLEGVFAGDLARLRRRESRANPPRRLVLASGLAVAALVAAVVVAPMLSEAPAGRLYESAPGQIMDVALDDGSRMTLDAGSAVRVAFARDVRRVTLERGGAYFEVAHDAAHPFQVGLADRRVIVTGTRFVTTLAGDLGEVFLLQGRVVVESADAADKGALDAGLVLAPGERAVFSRGQPGLRKAAADVEAATAWRQHRLIFKDAPLSAVVAAASRYSSRPLVVADSRLDQVRVTAVLPLDGEGELSDRMAGLLPIRTERTADGRILVRAE